MAGDLAEYPPLLVPGLQPMTLDGLQALCVTSFPLSGTTPRIMAGLKMIIDRLSQYGIRGDLWVNGSFLTRKIDPSDSDVVLFVRR